MARSTRSPRAPGDAATTLGSPATMLVGGLTATRSSAHAVVGAATHASAEQQVTRHAHATRQPSIALAILILASDGKGRGGAGLQLAIERLASPRAVRSRRR